MWQYVWIQYCRYWLIKKRIYLIICVRFVDESFQFPFVRRIDIDLVTNNVQWELFFEHKINRLFIVCVFCLFIGSMLGAFISTFHKQWYIEWVTHTTIQSKIRFYLTTIMFIYLFKTYSASIHITQTNWARYWWLNIIRIHNIKVNWINTSSMLIYKNKN